MTLNQLNRLLVCPLCRHPLKLQLSFICSRCHQVYPIKNNIPILLPPNLQAQEKHQQKIFNRRYRQGFKLQPWHQSMLNRIFCQPFAKSGQTYLDIGCGPTGYTLSKAAQKGLTAIGIDISYTAALFTHQKTKKYPHTAVIVASAQHLPFASNTFDYISAVSVIEHLKNPKLNTSILKKEGRLFLVVPNSYHQIPLIIRPLKKHFDKKIGHLHDFSLNQLTSLYQPLKLQKYFYNGHWLKLLQIVLAKAKIIPASLWWQIEKHDINTNPTGVQLNALFQKP